MSSATALWVRSPLLDEALTEHDLLGGLLASAGLFSRTLPHEVFTLPQHDPLGRLLASTGVFSHTPPHEAFAPTSTVLLASTKEPQRSQKSQVERE